ncbi:MAG: hypothetical protein PVG33_13660 [Chloroflexota bacterium]|jgi:hypothetical protein
MRLLFRRSALVLLPLLILAALSLVACGQGEAVPTLAPTSEPLPATPVPLRPTLPPPAIISLPAGAEGSAAISVPTGDTNSQVVVQTSAAGAALPEEIQRLLADLDSGALMLNSSPAGQGGEPVNYAYRDLNGDGVRDLVIIVVAEPVSHDAPSGAADPAVEEVQAIGIDLEELVASISQNPDAPLVRSPFVYTLSQEELDQIDR